MTLQDYLVSLRNHWLLIVIAVMVGGAAGFAAAAVQAPTYRAQSSVMVIPTQGATTSELLQGSSYVQDLVSTYAVLASSPKVLGPVAQRLGLEQPVEKIARKVTVETPLNTVVINISVDDGSAEQAAELANGIAGELSTAVAGLSPTSDSGKPAVRIATIEEAGVPEDPVSPNVRLLVLVGAVIGLVAGVVGALLFRLLATRVGSVDDVKAVVDTPVLGTMEQLSGNRVVSEALQSEPLGLLSESVRHIVANLRFANLDRPTKVFLVTSGSPGEGKSSLAVAMSQVIAEQGARVLLVDIDLRRPSIATATQLDGLVGLTTVLLGDVTEDDAIQRWEGHGIDVLTSGRLPPNPGQVLTSPALAELLHHLRDAYDTIVVDSPPILSVADALWLAPAADGVVVLARTGRTKREALRRTIAALSATRAPILGLVLNGVRRSRDDRPYYYRTEDDPRRSQKQ